MALKLSRRRYVAYATVAVGLGAVASLLMLLAIDLYLHHKYQNTASVNVWGYRGPTIGRKAPGEIRVVVLGGSAAFGHGPDWDASFPYFLERRLNEKGRRASVVNLAYMSERALSFRPTLEDYEYLDFDIAILYEGYNDLPDSEGVEGPPHQPYRRRSGVFRLLGYLPIFPMVFQEKAWALLYGGNISHGYAGAKTVFRPGFATEVTANALEAASTAQALERQLGRLTRDINDDRTTRPTEGCTHRWQQYCGAVDDAIRWARSHGKGVIVGTQPYISDLHIEQQSALTGMLRERFQADPAVRHVNLGRAVDLKDPQLCYDGMHLLAAGNQVIADGFVTPVIEMAERIGR